MSTLRLRCWLAGLWAGMLLTVAALAAPSAFAVLERAQAGRYVGRLFAAEAYISLAVAVLLILLERRQAASLASVGQGSRFSLNLGLVLGALFCTVAGYFALQPMMEQARAGQAAMSFAALHGVSSGFFALKALAVMALAWRCAPR
jgi:Domain of unknown function (DUF4149)